MEEIGMEEGRLIVDSEVKTSTFYHMTPTRLVERVEREGLAPSSGISTSGATTKGRLYLAAHVGDLQELLDEMRQRGCAHEPFTLLGVKLPKSMILREDPDTFGSETFYYVKRWIFPEYVRVLGDMKGLRTDKWTLEEALKLSKKMKDTATEDDKVSDTKAVDRYIVLESKLERVRTNSAEERRILYQLSKLEAVSGITTIDVKRRKEELRKVV